MALNVPASTASNCIGRGVITTARADDAKTPLCHGPTDKNSASSRRWAHATIIAMLCDGTCRNWLRRMHQASSLDKQVQALAHTLGQLTHLLHKFCQEHRHFVSTSGCCPAYPQHKTLIPYFTPMHFKFASLINFSTPGPFAVA